MSADRSTLEIPRVRAFPWGKVSPLSLGEASEMERDEPVLESAEKADRPCAACGSTSVMTIRMAFEGSPVTVQVCGDCDQRTWNREGRPVDIDRLLPAMRSTSRRR